MNFKGFSGYYYLGEVKTLPKLVMPIGISGSGKSSWMREMFSKGGYVVISPDKVRKELTGDISNHEHEEEVWKNVERATANALKRGDNVILDATNVNTEKRREFIKKMPPHRPFAKIFNVSPKEAIKRVKKDIAKGIDRSNVPEEVIMKQYDDFIDTLNTIEDEGFIILKDNGDPNAF